MDPLVLSAFGDEMAKIAGFADLWQRFLDIFRTPTDRANRQADYFFSPKAGDDRWRKLTTNVGNPDFVKAISRHPDADPKLQMHVQSLHDLSKGKPLAKIQSSRVPGKTYEIRSLGSDRLGCQCGDWHYKGSVTPGYECKHIRAFRQGKLRAD